MTPVTHCEGRTLALFGLGGSGLATADALKAGGARVIVWDDSEPARDKATAAGHDVVDLHNLDWSGIASLVLTPGVPLTHPEPHWSAKRATAAGVEIIGDIELFCRETGRGGAGRAARRHHGHERQIDDDGTDGASVRLGRVGCARWAAISARRCWPCHLRRPGGCMSSRSRPIRSTSRRASRPRSGSCSTSAPTTSIGTARWSITRPSRNG